MYLNPNHFPDPIGTELAASAISWFICTGGDLTIYEGLSEEAREKAIIELYLETTEVLGTDRPISA